MTFTKRSVIVETAAAWEECGSMVYDNRCMYGRLAPSNSVCPDCNGEGGRWHEAVGDARGISHGYYWSPEAQIGTFTKSTLLQREWEVCSDCRGSGEPCATADCKMGQCTRCQGTGAEPGSQGSLRVK